MRQEREEEFGSRCGPDTPFCFGNYGSNYAGKTEVCEGGVNGCSKRIPCFIDTLRGQGREAEALAAFLEAMYGPGLEVVLEVNRGKIPSWVEEWDRILDKEERNGGGGELGTLTGDNPLGACEEPKRALIYQILNGKKMRG